METVKLFNKGKRTIQFAGGELKAGKTGSFPLELGARLSRLYPDELQNLEQAIEVFHAPVAEPVSELVAEDISQPTDSLSDLTLEELKKIADERGVEYHHKAGKEKLLALLAA